MNPLNLHRIITSAWSAACLALFAANAGADETLSLPRALALAEQHSPLLQSAVAQRGAAEAALVGAAAYPNPEMEVAAGRFRPRPLGAETGRSEALALSQPVEWGGLRSARRQAAQAGLNAGDALLEQTRIDLRSRIKLAYFEVLRRDGEARLAAENHALLVQIRNRVKLRVEVGESPRYELVKAEAETLNAENQSRSAQSRAGQGRATLRSLLGADLPAHFDLEPPPAVSTELPPLDALRREMQERLPALRAAEAETSRAQARLETERSLRLPQPTVKWSAERDLESSVWRVGVALPLPLWNRREGPIGEAVAGLHQAEAEARRTRLALLNELEQAYGRYRIAQSQVEVFESGLMREAEAALKVAEAAYRFGERSILDYLDAQRTLRTVRLDFLNARYELHAALIEIERLRAAPFDGASS